MSEVVLDRYEGLESLYPHVATQTETIRIVGCGVKEFCDSIVGLFSPDENFEKKMLAIASTSKEIRLTNNESYRGGNLGSMMGYAVDYL